MSNPNLSVRTSINRAIPPTFEDDFSGYADQAAADAAWASSDTSKIRVNISTEKIDFDYPFDNVNQAIAHDFGLNISNTAFVIRYLLRFSTITPVNPGCNSFFTVSDSDESVDGDTNQIALTSTFLTRATIKRFDLNYSVSEVLGANIVDSTNLTFLIDTDYFVEKKRLTATTASFEIFTNSDFETGSLGKSDGTISSSADDFQYFKFITNKVSNSGAQIGTIDGFKFWDGLTEV